MEIKATMKKILLTVFILSSIIITSYDAKSFVLYEEKKSLAKTKMDMTGYIDYAPFGWVDTTNANIYGKFNTVFQPMIDWFIKEYSIEMNYDLYQKKIDDLAQKVRQGDIDFFVGAYFETEIFKGLHLLYPAVIYNPITVFMLPNRINEVKSTDDLKKLKGVRNTYEYFSDFVEKKVAELNPMKVDSSYTMFEKLFTREADYIITSYYYGMIEAIKLGLKKQIAPAKQTLWNIPVFVGVSKISQHRDFISKRLTKYLQDKNNADIIQKNLQKIISDFEKQYEGVVPPTFGLEKPETTEKQHTSENLDNNLDAK